MKNIDGCISKLTIFRDVTERKKADEVIQKLNKALELKVVDLDVVTRLKTEFLSVTSQELRTPLTDYGIGISKDDIDKLFKPFSQIDPSFRREHGGTGLGLAIAKGLLQAHKGKIWVESELGKGSTFFFSYTNRAGNYRKRSTLFRLNAKCLD